MAQYHEAVHRKHNSVLIIVEYVSRKSLVHKQYFRAPSSEMICIVVSLICLVQERLASCCNNYLAVNEIEMLLIGILWSRKLLLTKVVKLFISKNGCLNMSLKGIVTES